MNIFITFAAELKIKLTMTDNIINHLNSLDHHLTVLLNYDGGPLVDNIWLVFTSRLLWVLPALALIFHLYHNKNTRKQTIFVVIALVVLITLCDQTTSALMKPYFARLRPSHTPGVENLLHYVNGYRGGQYGFASSHAANSFGAVTFVSLLLKRRWVTVALFLLALCVCYSRIYLGVHFFGDLFVGAIIGCIYGFIVYHINNIVYLRLTKQQEAG